MVIFLSVSPFLVASFTLVRALDRLERRLAEDAISSIQSTVEAELVKLQRTAGDWAFWTATWQFIDDLNEAYIEENLSKEAFETLHLRAMLFYDVEGRLRHQAAFDPDTENVENLSQEVLERIQATAPKFPGKDARECLTGLHVVGEQALFSAACPILTSDMKGPSRGTLVMIREVDEEFIRLLEQAASHTVSIGTIALEGDASAPNREPLSTFAFFSDHITGRVVFPDLSSSAGLQVETTLERSIRREGIRSFFVFASALAALALVALGFLWSFMDRRVLRRIRDLVMKLQHAPLSSEDRLGDRTSDEIVALHKSIEGLLHALERSVERDIEQRREIERIVEQHPVGIVLLDQEKKGRSLGPSPKPWSSWGALWKRCAISHAKRWCALHRTKHALFWIRGAKCVMWNASCPPATARVFPCSEALCR